MSGQAYWQNKIAGIERNLAGAREKAGRINGERRTLDPGRRIAYIDSLPTGRQSRGPRSCKDGPVSVGVGPRNESTCRKGDPRLLSTVDGPT